jgi:hypothetical protein
MIVSVAKGSSYRYWYYLQVLLYTLLTFYMVPGREEPKGCCTVVASLLEA